MRVETLQLPKYTFFNIIIFPFSTLHAGRDAATPHRPRISPKSTAFSTLHAGRDAATAANKPSNIGDSDLSVPSMRVETLQPQYKAMAGGVDSTTFQYPPCGSRRCNARRGCIVAGMLNFQYPPCGSRRCNWSSQCSERRDLIFQYPPCGSRRCNALPESRDDCRAHLSVPSMRVETLQLSCTDRPYAQPQLSVPSMRVETLQQKQ